MDQVVDDGSASQDQGPGGQATTQAPPTLHPRRALPQGIGDSSSTKARSHSAEVEESALNTLVSSWLEDTYPAERPRRHSTSAISVNNNLNDGQNQHDNEDYKDGEEGQDIESCQVSRVRAKSEPAMATRRNSIKKPPLPQKVPSAPSAASAPSQSPYRPRSPSKEPTVAGTGKPPTTSGSVDAGNYRRNLADSSGIFLREFGCPLPAAVQVLVDSLRIEEPPPVPTNGDRADLRVIRAHNTKSRKALQILIRPTLKDAFFPMAKHMPLLMRTDNLVMEKATVPCKAYADARVSVPAPDILYGYEDEAFSTDGLKQLQTMLGDLINANNSSLMILPFLAVELKGDGGSGWSCTNQCLGGSSTCVNIGKHLSGRLMAKNRLAFHSTSFSIAMNHEHATLYVTWRPGPDTGGEVDPNVEFYMQPIEYFALQSVNHFLMLRRTIRRILDWGMGERLAEVNEAIRLFGTNKRKASDEGQDLANCKHGKIEDQREEGRENVL